MDFCISDPSGGTVEIKDLNRVNVILGRNGAGKSRLLRLLDQQMRADAATYRVSYVTPERAGTFQRDANVETNSTNSPEWAATARRANQAAGFKAMSHLALRNAERAYLRKLQGVDARALNFQTDCLDPISRMLNNVAILQGDQDFDFCTENGTSITASELSSGESETIALASEVLSFLMSVDKTKTNVLLLDEPDVHQHPDLQARFGQYLLDRLTLLGDEERAKVVICIATHSTPLVCALASSTMTSVGTKEFDRNTIAMTSPEAQLRKVAPFFGHPLSLSLSKDPMLILEGEDDERVWQQAARSSQGKIRLFPVLATSVDQQSRLEKFSDKLLKAIYDTPEAHSLRDGDGTTGPLDDTGCVKRYRLQCYAIENMLVTTECLAKMGVPDWSTFQQLTNAWIASNSGHPSTQELQDLISSPDRRRHLKIKNIRNSIVEIAGLKKPWEVIVGQALAGAIETASEPADPFALLRFVGADAARALLKAV